MVAGQWEDNVQSDLSKKIKPINYKTEGDKNRILKSEGDIHPHPPKQKYIQLGLTEIDHKKGGGEVLCEVAEVLKYLLCCNDSFNILRKPEVVVTAIAILSVCFF